MSYKLSFFKMAGEKIEVVDKWLRDKVAVIKEVAYSGSYNDLNDKPTIPAAANNGTLTIQRNGTDVATFTADQSGNTTANISVVTSYNDLNDKPTIPAAANNGTLTIQRNGTDVATFTADQSGNTTANISVPTIGTSYSNPFNKIRISSKGYVYGLSGERSVSVTNSYYNVAYYADVSFTIPSGAQLSAISTVLVQTLNSLGLVSVDLLSYSTSQINVRVWSPVSETITINFVIHMFGDW